MPEPLDRCELPWLEARAAIEPNRPAIVFENRRLSFRELADEVELAAGRLCALGTKPGDRVALLMDASLRMVEIIHAAQRCGITLVPLNTRLATAEIEALIVDAEPRLVLYDAVHSPTIDGIRERFPGVLFVEAERDFGRIAPKMAQPIHPDAGSVQTILYSSGTTGWPKGVMLTHANHWASAIASRANLGVRSDDRWLLAMPLYHVGGLSIVMRSVIDGIPIVLHRHFDPARVNAAIRNQGITLMSVVSTMLFRMIDENCDERYPSTLRCVLLGGGPVAPSLVARSLAAGIPVTPTYGLTEAASQVATAAVGDAATRPGSCGRPLPGTEVRLDQIDRDGRGEILVRGSTVMAGYFRRPKESEAALRGGWLHTGDIGHFDADGFLYIDDRRTDLIVTGGENVYPAEVENVMLAHPAVAEAAVYAVPDREWGQRVAASVVLRGGHTTDEAGLREWCAERLARFKIPATIDFAAALPRTPSGKIRRHMLRDAIGAWEKNAR